MALTNSSVSLHGHPVFSLGPIRIQLVDLQAVSGDTSGSFTVDRLARVSKVIVIGGGFNLTAQPTISGTTVTLAFQDPVATVVGTAICFGN